MSLSPELWEEIERSADESGDLARKAATMIVNVTSLAGEVTPDDLIGGGGRIVLDLEKLKARVYRYGGSGARFLIDLACSLDKTAAGGGEQLVDMRAFWDLDLVHRGAVLGVLQRYSH